MSAYACFSVHEANSQSLWLSNMRCLHISVSLCCLFFFWVGEEERIWSAGVGQPNSFSLLALVCFTSKCDCNLRAVFRFKFTTSPGFAEQKRGLKAGGSIGPHQTRFSSVLLNWCQTFSGARPKCIREREGDHGKEAYTICSWYGIKHWHEESVLSPSVLGLLHGCDHIISVCIYVCVRALECVQELSHKCQCLTVAWVSRVLTPSIPGEHMDAIMHSESERKILRARIGG